MSETRIPLRVVENEEAVALDADSGVIRAVSPTVDLERVTDPNPGVKITVKDVRGTHSETVLDGEGGGGDIIDDTTPAADKVFSSSKVNGELNTVKSDINSKIDRTELENARVTGHNYTVLLGETTITTESSAEHTNPCAMVLSGDITAGRKHKITFDGVEYILDAYRLPLYYTPQGEETEHSTFFTYIGEYTISDYYDSAIITPVDSVPFCIVKSEYIYTGLAIFTNQPGTHTIKIERITTLYTSELPKELIYGDTEAPIRVVKSPSTTYFGINAGANAVKNARGTVVLGFNNTVNGEFSSAIGIANKVNGNKSHAIASHSQISASYCFVEGEGNKALQDGGHAEGFSTTSNGGAAHAEGNQTVSSASAAHAEGFKSTASGEVSHAEGSSTVASGSSSHAEGKQTTASGIACHSEGSKTTASGSGSHAEGNSTTASGNMAHSEGFSTIANHRSQHVFGEYNTPDPSTAATTAKGNFIEIVGNGTSATAKSNARTLDWDGNEELAGSLTLGKGTANEQTITAAQLKALVAMLPS